MLDDLERALGAAEQHEEAQARGGRPARAPLARRGAARRRAWPRSRRTGKFDPHVHEALLTQPPRPRRGRVIEVLQKGYRSATACCAARVVVAARRRGGDET